MPSCDACGYENRLADGRWRTHEQGETMEPPFLVIECPDCGGIVDVRVPL